MTIVVFALMLYFFVASDSLAFSKSRSSLRVLAQLDHDAIHDAEEWEIGIRVTATSTPPKYPGAAIVTLAGGDTSARHLVALLRSLRDVATELPIIVLLARGGLGSAACSNQTWKDENNRSRVACGGFGTIGE